MESEHGTPEGGAGTPEEFHEGDPAAEGVETPASGGEGVDEEAIRRRAYEIYEREGGDSPDDNWARAERELREEGG